MTTPDQEKVRLVDVLRAAYLDRSTGVIKLEGEGTTELVVRDGEVFVDRDWPEAKRLRELLDAIPQDVRPATIPELRELVENIARKLAKVPLLETGLAPLETGGQELVGPLPTVVMLREVAVYGRSEQQILQGLGGPGARFLSHAHTPAVEQLPGLGESEKLALAAIEQPAQVGELLRGAGGQRRLFLHGLGRLWAVGLAQSLDSMSEESLRPSQKVLSAFADRIADGLATRPFDLSRDEHRRRLADLLGHHGEMNFYELLDVRPKATDREIFGAYTELARVVHPSHAPDLGLKGKGEAVRFLFERVTEAYLTLSDPRRRASYNLVEGIQVDIAVDRDQRRKEKAEMAMRSYRRASVCLAEMDYSQAVDLLKEATRLDPRPEYFARLGQAQAKNPKWRHHAVRAYEAALKLRPGDAGTLTAYGGVLEEMERFDEARQAYRDALAQMPDNVEARKGLQRLR